AVRARRARHAAARGGLPPVRERHRRRGDAVRGGPRVDREAGEGRRIHGARGAEAAEARGREAPAGRLQGDRAESRRPARLRRVPGWYTGGRGAQRHGDAHGELRDRDDVPPRGRGQAGHPVHDRRARQAGAGGGDGDALCGAEDKEIESGGWWRFMRIGLLTISDLGAIGERADTSGDAILEWAGARGYEVAVRSVVPDETDRIVGKLVRWADSGEVDVILTTGGTGLTERDVTPEATQAVVERLAPGIAEALRGAAAPKFPRAWLSRGVAGTRGKTLIVNLPGSTGGVAD